MDNLNENKLFEDLTPEELENIKGGGFEVPDDIIVVAPTDPDPEPRPIVPAPVFVART